MLLRRTFGRMVYLRRGIQLTNQDSSDILIYFQTNTSGVPILRGNKLKTNNSRVMSSMHYYSLLLLLRVFFCFSLLVFHFFTRNFSANYATVWKMYGERFIAGVSYYDIFVTCSRRKETSTGALDRQDVLRLDNCFFNVFYVECSLFTLWNCK